MLTNTEVLANIQTMLSKNEYQKMVKQVNRLRNEVNLFSVEEISEAALDDLKHKITEFETAFPDQILPDSPNYTIAGGVAEGFQKYTHKRRMLSLNDVFDYEELTDWEQRFLDYGDKNGVENGSPTYICEPKIDGLAISLIYIDGKLTHAVTRGDGYVGELVTSNVMQIQSIPKSIEYSGELEVRGEVFLTKSDFLLLNYEIENGQKVGKMNKTGAEAKFANPRNAASGTLRQLDSSVVAGRRLSFIAYNAIMG